VRPFRMPNLIVAGVALAPALLLAAGPLEPFTS
jgi:hypothetical protein